MTNLALVLCLNGLDKSRYSYLEEAIFNEVFAWGLSNPYASFWNLVSNKTTL